MAIPETWRTVDDSAWTDDASLPSALLKRTVQCTRYLYKNNTRCATHVYDAAERPVMCGAYSGSPTPTSTDEWAPDEFVAIPFIWEPVDARTIRVTVSVDHIVPSGTGTFVLKAAWQELPDFRAGMDTLDAPRIPTDSDHVSPKVTLTTAGKSRVVLTLDVSKRLLTGPLLVWVMGLSSITNAAKGKTAAGSLTKIRSRVIEVNDPTFTTDTRPTLAIKLNTPATVTTFAETVLQVTRLEVGAVLTSAEEAFSIWPFVDGADLDFQRRTSIKASGGSAGADLFTADLTSVRLYGVSIEDIATSASDIEGMMDTGVGAGSTMAQIVYGGPSGLFLRRGAVHAIGSTANTTIKDNSNPTFTTARTFGAASIAGKATWYPLGNASISYTDKYRLPGDAANKTRTGIRVRALVAFSASPAWLTTDSVFISSSLRDHIQTANISGVGEARMLDVSFRAVLADTSGLLVKTSPTILLTMEPLVWNSSLNVSPARDVNKFAAVMGMERAVTAGDGWAGTYLLNRSHTHFDAPPMAAWDHSIAVLVDLLITDDQTTDPVYFH